MGIVGEGLRSVQVISVPRNCKYFNIKSPTITTLVKYFAALTYWINRRWGLYLYLHWGVFHGPQVRPFLRYQIRLTRNVTNSNVAQFCGVEKLTSVGHGRLRIGPSASCGWPADDCS